MNNDITFCSNKKCPARDQCRRGKEPTKSTFSVMRYKFDQIQDGVEVACLGWWRIESEH